VLSTSTDIRLAPVGKRQHSIFQEAVRVTYTVDELVAPAAELLVRRPSSSEGVTQPPCEHPPNNCEEPPHSDAIVGRCAV
jgi:hypothetical protein